MKKYVNGQYMDLTAEEIAAAQAEAEQMAREYWRHVDYGEAVNTMIRERYSLSQEFALLRQMLKKPEEFAAYFAYCEECKAYVKEKMAEAAV